MERWGFAVIDLHSHILPGFDDGAQSMQELLDMAHVAVESGTRHMVCTPHCTIGDPDLEGRARAILQAVRSANAALQQAGIALTLHAGMELLLGPRLTAGSVLTLAGSRYLLIEFDFSVRHNQIDTAIEAVQQGELCPILAHPERYVCVQKRPELVAGWFGRCLIQVNKGSITGGFGREVQRTAHWIVERGFAHLVASDAHSASLRTPDMRRAWARVCELASEDYARLLFEGNPGRIVQNLEVLPPEALNW